MKHTILVHGPHVAVIREESPTYVTVTTYVHDVAGVEHVTTSTAEAERWARRIIDYPYKEPDTHD